MARGGVRSGGDGKVEGTRAGGAAQLLIAHARSRVRVRERRPGAWRPLEGREADSACRCRAKHDRDRERRPAPICILNIFVRTSSPQTIATCARSGHLLLSTDQQAKNLTATKDEVNSLRTRTQHPTVQAPPAARLTSSPSLIVAHSIPVEHRKPKIERTVRPRKTFEMDCEQSKIRGVSGGEMSASVREGAHCWQPR